jgi:hypothetical protein
LRLRLFRRCRLQGLGRLLRLLTRRSLFFVRLRGGLIRRGLLRCRLLRFRLGSRRRFGLWNGLHGRGFRLRLFGRGRRGFGLGSGFGLRRGFRLGRRLFLSRLPGFRLRGRLRLRRGLFRLWLGSRCGFRFGRGLRLRLGLWFRLRFRRRLGRRCLRLRRWPLLWAACRAILRRFAFGAFGLCEHQGAGRGAWREAVLAVERKRVQRGRGHEQAKRCSRQNSRVEFHAVALR